MRKTASLFALMVLTVGISLQCQETRYRDGKVIYQKLCAHCHMENGSGLGEVIPALTPESLNERKTEVACLIHNGIMGESMDMPAQPQLNAVELTNLLNYVYSEIGKMDQLFKVQEVEKQVKECSEN